jgi:chaperonin GroES
MKFRALSDLLVIERDSPQTITASGIIIPEMAQAELDQGTVIKAGPGRTTDHGAFIPNEVKEGDKVLFSKYANLGFKMDGKEYTTMHPADIIGVIEGDQHG